MALMDNERIAQELGGRRGMIACVNVIDKKRWRLNRKLVEGKESMS